MYYKTSRAFIGHPCLCIISPILAIWLLAIKSILEAVAVELVLIRRCLHRDLD